jgi:hypothetical protein
MTAAASSFLFRRYRVLSSLVLLLTGASLVQIIFGGASENFNARRAASIDEQRFASTDDCWTDKDYSETPRLLCAYGDYNVVRVGKSYLGVARELGPIDLPAILANEAPQPPATKFIVASDLSSLQVTLKALEDADEPPRLLYAYNGYNVLRLGKLYVAAARALGPINPRDFIAQPPDEQFIVAHSIWILNASMVYMTFKKAVMNSSALLFEAITRIRSKLHV